MKPRRPTSQRHPGAAPGRSDERPRRGAAARRPEARPPRGDGPKPSSRPEARGDGGKPSARGGRADARPPRGEGGKPAPRPRRAAAPPPGRNRHGSRPRLERGERDYYAERLAAARDKGAVWTPGPGARTIRAEAGLDLAHFIVQHTKGRVSVRGARTLLEDGCCRINGRIETFGSRKLAVGDIVEVILPPEPTEHVFEAKRVLYSDEHLLAYDKPAFLPVTPTDAAKSWSLLDILRGAVEGAVIPVHRLDADTSGIVLFAREERMARRLEELFAAHQVAKTYRAIVRGHPPAQGKRRSYLIKVESGKGFERWKSGRGADAREAVTEWEVEERIGRYASLVRVEPKTGRYHQIRIHFSEIGHALYGDRLYGDRLDPVHVHRHLLHACTVAFAHPVTGLPVRIESPLPRDMREAMAGMAKV